MNPVGIINRQNQCLQALSQGNTQLKTLSLEKAKTEREYRVALAQEILRLKTEKHPATLAMKLAEGNEQVADLRLKRDVAESSYFTCISAIENLRLEADILRSQLAWLKAEMTNS
jgi:capsule polysaccharide export protein KpsE/RkpR